MRPQRANLILAACILGSSMAFLDSTAVNVALPAIRDDLGAGLSRGRRGYGLIAAASEAAVIRIAAGSRTQAMRSRACRRSSVNWNATAWARER